MFDKSAAVFTSKGLLDSSWQISGIGRRDGRIGSAGPKRGTLKGKIGVKNTKRLRDLTSVPGNICFRQTKAGRFKIDKYSIIHHLLET